MTHADAPPLRRAVERVVALDGLRVAAVLGVVAIHVTGIMVSNPEISGSMSWWLALAVNAGNIWVVPVFVMVSGALLLGEGTHRNGPASFYRRRLLRLGPAFVFWPLFYIFVVRMLISGAELTPLGVVGLLAAGTPYTHLYFLFLIVGLYAVAPVLAAFLRGGGEGRARIFAASALAATILTYTLASVFTAIGQPQSIVLNALTQWLPYVGYFLAGWALRVFVPRGTTLAVVVIATVGLLAEIVWQSGTRADHPTLNAVLPLGYLGLATALAACGVFLSFQGIFAAVALPTRARRVLATLSDAAFGVFLVHFVVLILVRMAVAALGGAVTSSLTVTVIIWLVVVVISFAISLIARRVPYLRRLF
ncbi:acyltransferase [Agromyces sp. NPDC058126]|uniref:acyltransferase n=1 Tax=Agromyces sp. NPDC058126 TaxID=3346350 RepID=UPI0036DA0F13